jgi:hypothetical protein
LPHLQPVPEPGTLVLVSCGLGATFWRRRRTRANESSTAATGIARPSTR